MSMFPVFTNTVSFVSTKLGAVIRGECARPQLLFFIRAPALPSALIQAFQDSACSADGKAGARMKRGTVSTFRVVEVG
jgi:hypothetical protein